MSNITIYKTKSTTLRDLYDHFEDLEEENLDFVVKFFETQLGLKYIADMGKLDWDGDILSLVSLTSDMKKEGEKLSLPLPYLFSNRLKNYTTCREWRVLYSSHQPSTSLSKWLHLFRKE